MNGEIDYEGIRARVEQRMKKRRKFMSNVGGYATAMAVLWVIYLFTGGGWPWPLIPTGILVIVALREFLDTFVFSPAMDNAYDREMMREIARERARLGLDRGSSMDYTYEKPKHIEKVIRQEPWVRLSDDGELIPIDEEESNGSERRSDQMDQQ